MAEGRDQRIAELVGRHNQLLAEYIAAESKTRGILWKLALVHNDLDQLGVTMDDPWKSIAQVW